MHKFWKNKKALIITGASILSLLIVSFGGYELYDHLHKQEEEPEIVEEESVTVIDDEATAEAFEIPEFKKVILTSESVEKDLTIFISDTEDENVQGTNFSVKLINPDDEKALDSYIAAIEEINEKLDAYGEGGDSNSEVTSVKIINDDGSVHSSEQGITAIEQLYVDKQAAMEAYGQALEGIKGETLVDDDADGVITKSELEPGDYMACLVFDPNWETNFEPSEYANAVNVKDKVETKIVVNIKKKIKKDDSAEDGQKKAVTEVEKVLQDTVAFVESTDKVETKIESTTKVKVPAGVGASTAGGYKASKKSDDSVAKSVHTYAAKKKYKVTVNYIMLDENGDKITTSSNSCDVEEGGTYTVEATTIDGYNFESADPAVGTKLTIKSDTTVNLKYKIVPTKKEDSESETKTDEEVESQSEEGAAPVAKITGLYFSKKRGAANEGSASATISSSFADSKFNIETSTTGDAKLSDLKVNGDAIAIDKSPYSYTVKKAGEYKISVAVTYSDGVKETIYNTWEVSGSEEKNTSTEKLTDEEGHTLYVDKECKKEATVADYQNGTKTFYYKKETHKYTGFQAVNGVTYYYDANGNKVTGTQVINGVSYNFGSDGGLMVSGTGIDVSKYQGNIDWAKAKTSISFAIIRCGYRGMKDGQLHEDPYFYKNMKNAKANGVAVGVYLYSTALNEAEAVEEASMAVEMAKAAGGCSYPIYIDMEDTTRGVSSLSNEQRTAIVNAFCKTVQSAGMKAGVYASKNWLSQRLNTSGLSGSIQVWVAQYNTSCTYSGKYTMWQYSSKGSIPGISGNVDVNKSYF